MKKLLVGILVMLWLAGMVEAGDLVAHYRMDDNLATAVVIDSSGYGNNGTLTDPGGTATTAAHSVSGAPNRGKALSFDGDDDYITIPDDNSLDGTSALTISMWIKPDVSGSGVYRVLLAKRDGAVHYQLYLDNDEGANQGNIAYYDSTEFHSTYIPVVGAWTHIGCTVSGTNLILYADGVAVLDTTCGALTANTAPLIIGQTGDTNFFDGSIDDIRIYNYALTPAQILHSYNQSGYRGAN